MYRTHTHFYTTQRLNTAENNTSKKQQMGEGSGRKKLVGVWRKVNEAQVMRQGGWRLLLCQT